MTLYYKKNQKTKATSLAPWFTILLIESLYELALQGKEGKVSNFLRILHKTPSGKELLS